MFWFGKDFSGRDLVLNKSHIVAVEEYAGGAVIVKMSRGASYRLAIDIALFLEQLNGNSTN